MTVELEVQYAAEDATGLPTEQQINGWVRAALHERLEDAQLVVRIVDEDESRQLNERYRRGSGATNVLSFPFEQPGLLQPPLLGDVVVCAARVAAEAREQGKATEAHWAHLVVHGVLHLLGYDHEHHGEARVMEALEIAVLASLDYPNPYGAEKSPGNEGRAVAATSGATKQETNEQ